MSALEARYHRAKLDMHRAWVATQPQYVIPGLLDALDEPAATPPPLRLAAGSSSAPTIGGEATALASGALDFAEGMAEQGVTGLCDSGASPTVERAARAGLSARGKLAGCAPSRRGGQPPDSVNPCADRVPVTTTAPAADPRAEQRGRGDWRSS